MKRSRMYGTQSRPVIAMVSTSQNSSVDVVSPLTCEASRIELPQCTACLHRGHDSVVENDATIVVNVALGDSSGGLSAIDMVWLTPTRGADLFRCHVLCLQALICTHC